MDNPHRFKSNDIPVFSFGLAAFALLCALPAQAQQKSLNASYAKAALLSLRAIEVEDSSANDEDSKTAHLIDAASQQATTEQEATIAKMLAQIYRLRVRDNNLMKAYGKLIEIDSAEVESDELKKSRDAAVSQFADIEEGIEKREESCFIQLEQSLVRSSSETLPACYEWIQRAKTSDKE